MSVYVRSSVWYVHMSAGAQGLQQRVWGPLELE